MPIKKGDTRYALYQCGNCQFGTVEKVTITKGNLATIEVKKCKSCKKQYGVKELSNLHLMIE